jgi:xylose isomerase
VRDAFYLVKLLEDAGYSGMRHFDAHPYRTEDADGVWEFARGCIRTYLILRDKARRFHDDPEIQAALAEAKVGELATPTRPDAGIAGLRKDRPDPVALAQPGLGLEHLDQLVNELLLGVR